MKTSEPSGSLGGSSRANSYAGERSALARQRQGAEMNKLDSHETKTAFAIRVGLTKGRISQLVAEGLPVRADGRIDVAVGLA